MKKIVLKTDHKSKPGARPGYNRSGVLDPHAGDPQTVKKSTSPYLLLLLLLLLLFITYFMAQQPFNSFDRPLMRVSLSNSLLVTLIFY